MPDYEQLATSLWPRFQTLSDRSTLFQVLIDRVKRDTFADLAAALESSLSIRTIALAVPEVGEEPLATIADGIEDLGGESEGSIHVTGSITDLDMELYVEASRLMIVVDAATIQADASDPSTPSSPFRTLVQLGLELCGLTRARALYLLDDDDEFDIADEWGGSVEPVWERSIQFWPPTDEEELTAEEQDLEWSFSSYFQTVERRLHDAGFSARDSNAADADVEALFHRTGSQLLGLLKPYEYVVVGYTVALDPEMVPWFIETAVEACGLTGREPKTTVYAVMAATMVAQETIDLLLGPMEPSGTRYTVVPVAVDLQERDLTVHAPIGLGGGTDEAAHARTWFGFDD